MQQGMCASRTMSIRLTPWETITAAAERLDQSTAIVGPMCRACVESKTVHTCIRKPFISVSTRYSLHYCLLTFCPQLFHILLVLRGLIVLEDRCVRTSILNRLSRGFRSFAIWSRRPCTSNPALPSSYRPSESYLPVLCISMAQRTSHSLAALPTGLLLRQHISLIYLRHLLPSLHRCRLRLHRTCPALIIPGITRTSHLS